MSTTNNGDTAAGDGTKKFGFSLGNKKAKQQSRKSTAATAFGDPDEEDQIVHYNVNPDNPLVIPCKKDSRQSLQEQARAVRAKTEEAKPDDGTTSAERRIATAIVTDADRAAIQALKQEAAEALGNGEAGIDTTNNKRVIASTGDTFQRQSVIKDKDYDAKKLEKDVEELPPDLSVTSQVYKAVPISEFGAAMLRGMGWSGNDDDRKTKKNDSTFMPRPSRLGLGATPKMMGNADAPATHSRRKPLRPDQVQKEERLRQQQQEMEKERQRQFALDKQRTLQIGSIVYVSDAEGDRRRGDEWRRKRAMIVKLAGVPGLNMILLLFEGDTEPTKVKKGSIELVGRSDLGQRPFRDVRREESRRRSRDEDQYERKNHDKGSIRSRNSDDRERESRKERSDRLYRNDDDSCRDRSRDRDRDRDRHRDRTRDRDRDRTRDRDRDRHKRNRDDDRISGDDKKRHKSTPPSEDSSSGGFVSSWLIPSIRVRVVSSKYGRSVYKEKGVVVDVTRKGIATLKMGNGEVISAPERHLETALPKVGGNAIVLSGNQRFSKGRLLERDSKKNRGVVQVYEDMSLVTTSLDDMAEWCGPLDDDLDH